MGYSFSAYDVILWSNDSHIVRQALLVRCPPVVDEAQLVLTEQIMMYMPFYGCTDLRFSNITDILCSIFLMFHRGQGTNVKIKDL